MSAIVSGIWKEVCRAALVLWRRSGIVQQPAMQNEYRAFCCPPRGCCHVMTGFSALT